ncbi:hypothetical protein McaMca56_003937, partial [Microsporum canis]
MDRDLQAAIDASMEDAVRSQSNLRKNKSSIVDLTGDSDEDAGPRTQNAQRTLEEADSDAELQQAIQLSLQSAEHLTNSDDAQRAGSDETSSKSEHAESMTPSSGFGILGFDRRKMEEERLARLAKKRKAGDDSSAPSAARPLKASKQEISVRGQSTGKPSSTTNAATSKPVAISSEPSIQFPDGAVKKTWAFRCERKNDIKIEEVFQPSDLELAVLSSFLWDMDWLLLKFTNPKTRFLFIMGAKGEEKQKQLLEETASMPRIRLCFPPMEGEVNCMHSKLMLLFHPGYLRIVTPTANLDPYDWGEKGGEMEN